MHAPNQPAPPPRADDARRLFYRRYREVTVASLIFGVVCGGIMNAAITYSGLKIGFTIVGSSIAAVLGFGVLRGLLRRGSILEVNIGQTIASSVNTTNSGIIFTVPVLLLLGYSLGFGELNFWLITLAGMAGAILGVVFIVPMRKQMIDVERLRFPSATAVGAILKSPGAGAAKSLVLVAGILVAMLIYLPAGLPALKLPGYGALDWRMPPEPDPAGGAVVAPDGARRPALSARVDRDRDGLPDLILADDRIDVGRLIGLPDEMQLAFAIAPFALGAGFLTGSAGLMVLAGGLLAYLLLNPLAFRLGWMPETLAAHEVPAYALANFDRPLGIGLLLGGAFIGIVAALPAIREALRGIGQARAAGVGRDELGLRSLVVWVLIALVLILVAVEFVQDPHAIPGGWLAGLPPLLAKAVTAGVAVAWIWFAGIIIAQCTGMTDWSPISGMALLTVVLVMMLIGTGNVVTAVALGAALCVAISVASDMMADLKTGHIVGAQPRRQQIVELLAATLGPMITMATLVLIVGANLKQTGQPIGPGTPTVAPQAQALQAVITGVQGGEMPYMLYGLGAILGALLGLGAFPGLGVLVGLSMYLPIIYILTYGLGCIANMVLARLKGRTWTEEWGVPFCAGLIVGEAMLALVINSIVLIRG